MNKYQSIKVERVKNKVVSLTYEDGSPVAPLFQDYTSEEAYKFAGVRGYAPMLAKELEDEEVQNKELISPDNIIEEKFDGTRGILQFFAQDSVTDERIGYARVFSRNISKETGFYTENTDSLPHIRDTDKPDMAGTILDGELFINGLPFKEVSSTLNCLWDEAVARQVEIGFVTFHAFDILKYKGIDLRKMPLHRRKEYLHLAIEELDNPYIEEVKYYQCGIDFPYEALYEVVADLEIFISKLGEKAKSYPTLVNLLQTGEYNARTYYELIVASGGEGVIVKPKNGKYLHKRGWEYSKIKAFLTRELIILGFDKPEVEYTGKNPKNWVYWMQKDGTLLPMGVHFGEKDVIPVTKYHHERQVGNIIAGVLLTEDEYVKLKNSKKGKQMNFYETASITGKMQFYLEVANFGGFDEPTRYYFTRNQDNLIGKVVEVKANGLFKDTGRMRHPRYLRMRTDKNPEQCTWKDHVM